MTRRLLVLGSLALAGAALSEPALGQGGVTVLGAGNARMCFLAAESKMMPRPNDLKRCDDALRQDWTNKELVVATHVNRGILRLRRSDVAGAVADFNSASALNPNEPEAYLNRASALLRQQQLADAIRQFDEALAKKTRRPALAYYGRGVAHEEAGNLRAAYQDYKQASLLAPNWEDPRRELTRFRVARN